MTEESHPLTPFLPVQGKMLFLGSFPPPRARWSMDFFYPNWINDFWRMMGLIHFSDKRHFEVRGEKRFDHERIIAFAEAQGLAFYDTAIRVRRLKDNASDNFLEIIEPTDIGKLLAEMPHCHRLITTGGKASEELLQQLNLALQREAPDSPVELELPPIGGKVSFRTYGRCMEWWRMPSTSRAYPLPLEKKAGYYRMLFDD